jgi:hypothetical protein
MAINLLDDGNGFAKAGAGEVSQVAGRGVPWLYLFEIYENGDYDLVWIDRGSLPGKTVFWSYRRRGSDVKLVGPLIKDWDTYGQARVWTVDIDKNGNRMAREQGDNFTLDLANTAGMMRLLVGSAVKESNSPYLTSVSFFDKGKVATYKVTLFEDSGNPYIVVPHDRAGVSGFTIKDLSDRAATSGSA